MQYQLLRGKSKQKANIKLIVGNQLIFRKLQKIITFALGNKSEQV